MNQQIIQRLCQEYGIKNPNKQVKAALMEFIVKYSNKLLEKSKDISNQKITVQDVRVAYDLIHKIHTPEFENQKKNVMKATIEKVHNYNNVQYPESVSTVRLPPYGLRNSMTAKQQQIGMK